MTPHAIPKSGPTPLSSFEQIRLQSAIALWRIEGRVDDTLPVILDAFLNHNYVHDHLVLHALGEIGPPAKAAVPALVFELSNHPEVLNRYPEMTETLKRIDPDAAAKFLADNRNAKK